MASLRLPEPLINGLLKLLALSDESFHELISVVESAPLSIKQHRVFDEQILSNVRTIPNDDAKSIAEATFALHIGFNATATPLETFIEDITQALKEAKPDSTDLTGETLERLKGRLTQILSINSAKLIAKAHEVLLEHHRTFSEARILTDIRPVFGENADAAPIGAVLVHMLKIEYRQDGDSKEFFVALDTKDIDELMKVLERAKLKTESLKTLIGSSNVTYVDIV
jgi:hypothetical protein